MGKVLVLYRWRVFDPVRKRLITTRYRATEEQIRKSHPEATPIESTREDREISDDYWALSTNAFLRGK